MSNSRMHFCVRRAQSQIFRAKQAKCLLHRGFRAYKGSVSCISCRLRHLAKSCWKIQERRRLTVKALVAVDYSQPAIWLGLGLIAGGLSLYQLRRVTPVLSRDLDVVISSVVIFSGGILIFQGWRLDPLLLFCQLLTAGTALTWAIEAIKLRKVVENEQRFANQRVSRFSQNLPDTPADIGRRGIPLPAPQQRMYYDQHRSALESDEAWPMSLTQPASGRQDMYLVHASDNQPDEDYEQDLQDDEYFRVLESDYQDDLWSSEIPARSDDAETINREASTSRSAPDMHDQDSYHNRRWMSRPAAKESFSRHDNQGARGPSLDRGKDLGEDDWQGDGVSLDRRGQRTPQTWRLEGDQVIDHATDSSGLDQDFKSSSQSQNNL